MAPRECVTRRFFFWLYVAAVVCTFFVLHPAHEILKAGTVLILLEQFSNHTELHDFANLFLFKTFFLNWMGKGVFWIHHSVVSVRWIDVFAKYQMDSPFLLSLV